MIQTILVDRTNFADIKDQIITEIQSASFVGIDTETQDDARHEGLNRLGGYDPVTRKKAANKKTVFDFRRTVMTGFSVYPEGAEAAYYFNTGHADVHNRLGWDEARQIVEALPETSHWLAHNLPYELNVFKACYDYDLPRAICTLQLAVSAFGPDEYDPDVFRRTGQGGIAKLVPDLIRKSMGFENPQSIKPELEEVITKILAKESTSEWSYNGWVKEIAWGYGLKGLVKKIFKHEMTTFEQVLGGKAHMGQLSGEEVAGYGAEDAYWVVPLFHHLLGHMSRSCPAAIPAFFSQELPMVKMYSNIALGGWRVNFEAIKTTQKEERANNARLLRDLKGVIRQMLPFPTAPHEGLMKRDSWYANNWGKYRGQLEAWAKSPDSDDDFPEPSGSRGGQQRMGGRAGQAREHRPEP